VYAERARAGRGSRGSRGSRRVAYAGCRRAAPQPPGCAGSPAMLPRGDAGRSV